MNQKEYISLIEEVETRLVLRSPQSSDFLEQIKIDMKLLKQHYHSEVVDISNKETRFTYEDAIEELEARTQTEDGLVKTLFNMMFFHLAENKQEIAKDRYAYFTPTQQT